MPNSPGITPSDAANAVRPLAKNLVNSWRPLTAGFAVLAVLAIAEGNSNGAGEPSPHPLTWEPLSDADTEYSGFSTIGRISEIYRTTSNILVVSAKPFWAPWAPHVAIAALWPAKAPFVVHVSNGVPITIDGKKVGHDQLAVGQTIKLQYSIYVFIRGSDYVYCGARRIDGFTSNENKLNHR